MSKTPDPDDVAAAEDTAPATVADPADEAPAAPVEHTAPDGTDDVAEIASDWADAYPAGTELFVGEFGADDFEAGDYADSEYPDGATVAVKRCVKKPPPGWIRKHSHLSDLERTFALLEMHACQEALDVLDALNADAWNEYVEKWGEDGGLVPGKSKRSSRRAARRNRQ